MLQQRLTNAVAVRFFLPAPALRPFITTYYLTEVDLPTGVTIEDRLHPEWANIRFGQGGGWSAAVGGGPLTATPAAVATGPTSLATHFVSGAKRSWGIGLLPLGWARLIEAPAQTYADRFVGAEDPAFAGFAPLSQTLFGRTPDAAAEGARIDAFMLALLAKSPAREDEPLVARAHALLVDPGIASVGDFAVGLGRSARSLERLCLRVFGFSPKLLMRRQRFLRSLAQFMVDPSLKWISTLDWHYVDQAHFVRDFHRFMGMNPSAYAALDHPILHAAAQARLATAGAAMQALHLPKAAE